MSNTLSSDLKPIVIGASQQTLRESAAMTARANMNGALQQGQVLSGNLGQELNVGVPAALSASSESAGTTAPSPTDVNISSRTVTLNKFYSSTPFAFTGRESQEYDLRSVFIQQVQEAVRAVVYQMNSDMNALYIKVPNGVGTAGTGFFASNSQGLADLNKRLFDLKVPLEGRDLVLSGKDYQALEKLTELYKVNEAGSAQVRTTGIVPQLNGFNIWRDQQITTHTTGTITLSPTVGSAGAAYKAESIPVDCGTGAAVALKQGDLITFSENTAYTYAVKADVSITAGNSGTVTIYHGLKEAVTSSSTVALLTGHGTSLISIGGQLKGFTIVNRMPARQIFGVTPLGDATPIVDQVSGMGLLLIAYPGKHQAIYQVVGLYGMDVTDENRLCRVYSYSS